jgi:transposase
MASTMCVGKPDKRCRYDEAFKAEYLRLVCESRSTRAAARQLGISEKLLSCWQQRPAGEQAQDPAFRTSLAENQRLERELAIPDYIPPE